MHPEVHPTMEVEDINPIGKRQLAEFFAVAFQQDRISADAQRLAVAVRRVLKGLDPKDADYLPTVGQRASEELAKAMSGAAPWAPPATSRAFGS
jgi:predicted thioredoxin/glutaredoxin